MSDQQLNRSSQRKKGRLIWVLLALLCWVGTFASFLLPQLDGSPSPPQSDFALIFWNSILFATLWRWRAKPGLSGLGVGALVGIIGILVLHAALSYRSERVAVKDTVEFISSTVEGQRKGDSLSNIEYEDTFGLKSPAEVVRIVYGNMMKSIAEENNRYQAELEAAGYFDVLNLQAIRKDVDGVAANKIITDSLEVVDTYVNNVNELLSEFRRQIMDSDISQQSKLEITSEFDRGMADRKDQMLRMMANERKVILVDQEIVSLLVSNLENWSEENGEIRFHDRALYEQYQSLMDKSQALITEQENLRQGSATRVDNTLKSLQ